MLKDKAVYERMERYLKLNTMGVSRETQLRALKLLKVVIQGLGGEEDIFEFGYQTMRKRWERFSKMISVSKRLSLQKIPPQYCIFSQKVKEASPGNSQSKFNTAHNFKKFAAML